MGSYISVGFVFKMIKLKFKEQILKYLIGNLPLSDYSVLIYKTDTDIEGRKIIEKKMMYRQMSDEDYKIITDYDFGNILLMCNFLGIKNQMMNITFFKEKTHFGFLIELFEDPFRNKVDYLKQETLLVNFMKECFKEMDFDYAICDNEGTIEFSPEEISHEDFSYSILILPEGDKLVVKKGEYLIDGKTKR